MVTNIVDWGNYNITEVIPVGSQAVAPNSGGFWDPVYVNGLTVENKNFTNKTGHQMTKEDLIRTLKDDLQVQKEIVALKAVKEPPPDIPPYEGQAIPGMCALLGEILQEGKAWYVTRKNLGCFMSLAGTGTCKQLSRVAYLKFMISQNDMYRMHRDDDTVVSYYNKVDAFFKYPEHTGSGIAVGPLAKIDDPDLVFLIVTPHQTDILNRCRSYLGAYSRGFGGNGSCIFNIRY